MEVNNIYVVAAHDLHFTGSFARQALVVFAYVVLVVIVFEGKRYFVTGGVFDFNKPTLFEPFYYFDAEVRALSGLLGWAGKTADDTRVRLVLERKACSDGMSDEHYPVEAVLEVGGDTFRGCGRFLQE